jgi:hypothetical protein
MVDPGHPCSQAYSRGRPVVGGRAATAVVAARMVVAGVLIARGFFGTPALVVGVAVILLLLGRGASRVGGRIMPGPDRPRPVTALVGLQAQQGWGCARPIVGKAGRKRIAMTILAAHGGTSATRSRTALSSPGGRHEKLAASGVTGFGWHMPLVKTMAEALAGLPPGWDVTAEENHPRSGLLGTALSLGPPTPK